MDMYELDLGKVSIFPSCIRAGQVSTWTIAYTAGSLGIEREGGIRIYSHVAPVSMWTFIRWQFGAAFSESDTTRFSAHVRQIPWDQDGLYRESSVEFVDAKNEGGRLKPRETVKIILTNTRAPTFAMKNASFRIEVNPNGQDTYTSSPTCRTRVDYLERAKQYTLYDSPAFDIRPDDPARLRVVVSSTPSSSFSFDVKIRAEDNFGNVATGYRGKIRLHCTDEKAAIPKEYVFKEEDGGSAYSEDVD